MVSCVSRHLIFILLVVFSSISQAAEIVVSVDRETVEENESFMIEFTAFESVDDSPNFNPLKQDFRIINQNQSSNLQIINGRINRETKWSLILMPKKTGTLKIPRIQFGNDYSDAKTIVVKKSDGKTNVQGKSSLTIEAVVDKHATYIQAQILLVVRIYAAVELLNASLSEVSVSDDNAIIEKVSDNITYEKRINGRRYKVYEKRYAIFPQKSGELSINPIHFEAQYLASRLERRIKRLKTEAIPLSIKAKPQLQSLKNNAWMPASNIELRESWPQNPPVFKVGEPITRTITLVGDGLFSSQLAELTMDGVENMKQYPDKPLTEDKKDKNGVIGVKQAKIALIPTTSGRHVIPEMEISWWNVNKDRLEIARLPEREINVLPGAQAEHQSPPKASDSMSSVIDGAPSTVEHASPSQVEIVSSNNSSGFWVWVSIIAITGWLATGVAWWLNHRKGVDTPALDISTSKNNCKQLEKTIKQACENNNMANAKIALLRWGQCNWPALSVYSLGELGKFCGGHLEEQINNLNRCLYAEGDNTWDGQWLWQALSAFEVNSTSTKSKQSPGLAPLHRTVVN